MLLSLFNRQTSTLLATAVVATMQLSCLKAQTKEQITGWVMRDLTQAYHFSPLGVNDSLSGRAYGLYLRRIDPLKQFFTQVDIDNFTQFKYQMDDELQTGRYEFLRISSQLLAERQKLAKQFATEICAQPFDFKVVEEFETGTDKRSYAKDTAELREVWRKILKYQTLARFVDLQTTRDQAIKDLDSAKLKNTDTSQSLREKAAKTDVQLEDEARKWVLKNNNERFDRMTKDSETDRLGRYLNALALANEAHTEFFPPKEKEQFDIAMSGKLEGIGASLRETDGFIKVESLVPGGPAWKGKLLKPDDLILKVAQGEAEPVDVTDMRMEDAIRLIRGKKGTEVRLTVRRADGSQMVIPIIRDVIVFEETFAKSSIITDKKSGNKIGYTYLPKFYVDLNNASAGRQCAQDIREELDKLKAAGVKGMILDLRNNGGGSLQECVKMTGLFLPQGPVVQVHARGGQSQVLTDNDPSVVYDGPLVVMINEFSASASEILSAALQDYKRAVIVGSHSTFGKGTVQQFFDLDQYVNPEIAAQKPLGQIKLTIQKFYRITGRATQFKGVEADIELPDPYKFVDVGEKQLDYPLPYDTLAPSSFTMWNGKSFNLNTLKKNSEKRIKTNKAFQLYSKQAEKMKKQKDDTVVDLSLAGYKKRQEEQRAENKQFDEAQNEVTNLTFALPAADQTNEEEKKRKNDDWLGGLKKDVYIAECVAIIGDMISGK